MRIFGITTVGATPVDCAANAIEVDYAACPVDCYVAKLSVYMDGVGSGSGPQAHRAVVTTAALAVLGTSKETVVADGAPPGWVDFLFSSPLFVPKGDVALGIHSGTISNSSRVYRAAAGGAGGITSSDSYSDGTVSPLPTPAATAGQLAVFATYVLQFQQPDGTDDFHVSRLPFPEHQAIFGQGGPLSSPYFRVNCGWHGTDLDEEQGAVCIVKEGSELEALLGERIRIRRADQFGTRALYAFVHNRYPIIDDLSVSRRMFLALGYPAADYVRVSVEVMA